MLFCSCARKFVVAICQYKQLHCICCQSNLNRIMRLAILTSFWNNVMNLELHKFYVTDVGVKCFCGVFLFFCAMPPVQLMQYLFKYSCTDTFLHIFCNFVRAFGINSTWPHFSLYWISATLPHDTYLTHSLTHKLYTQCTTHTHTNRTQQQQFF